MGISRRGQAMMELVIGMFALALVVSALCGFATYIAKALRVQNELRQNGGRTNSGSDSVEVGEFASRYVFGSETLKIEERVEMPDRTILR